MSHSEPLVIKPIFVSVDQELLRRLHVVCNFAVENATDCLVTHDSLHGRTTRKNQVLAELYEQDVRQAKQALAEVRSALGWPAIATSLSAKANVDSLEAFEEWLTQECEKNNRILAVRYSDEADLRRDEELVHTITTLRRYKQQTPTDS